jgi:hypothetical protein
MKTVLRVMVVLLLLGAAGAAAFVYLGIFDVAATICCTTR